MLVWKGKTSGQRAATVSVCAGERLSTCCCLLFMLCVGLFKRSIKAQLQPKICRIQENKVNELKTKDITQISSGQIKTCKQSRHKNNYFQMLGLLKLWLQNARVEFSFYSLFHLDVKWVKSESRFLLVLLWLTDLWEVNSPDESVSVYPVSLFHYQLNRLFSETGRQRKYSWIYVPDLKSESAPTN